MMRRRSVRAALRRFVIASAVDKYGRREVAKAMRDNQNSLDRCVEALYRKWCLPYRDRVRQKLTAKAREEWSSAMESQLLPGSDPERFLCEAVEIMIDLDGWPDRWNTYMQCRRFAFFCRLGPLPAFIRQCAACGRAMLDENREHHEYCRECVAADEADRNASAGVEAVS